MTARRIAAVGYNRYIVKPYRVHSLTKFRVQLTAADNIVAYIVSYTAAIAGVDMEQYKAAEIDGANLWQSIIYVTIPSIKPMLVIMLIMKVGSILNMDMGLFYQLPMNQPALYEATNVISTYVYNLVTNSGSLSMGMASAASFVQSIVGFVLVVGANKVAKTIDSDTGLF